MARDCTGKPVTRAAKTEAEYRARYHYLRMTAETEALAGTDIVEVVDWFARQDDRWAEATVRKYRASLLFTMDSEHLHSDAALHIQQRLEHGPRPAADGPKQTSARKRKSLPVNEYLRLVGFLKASQKSDDNLLRGLVQYGVALFLRPGEFGTAEVVGTTLIVRNSKATNGRANGDTRERELKPMPDKAIKSLSVFLALLRSAAQQAGSMKRLLDRLSSRLARVCKHLKIRRVSLYTLRHVGMATAKIWMTPAEVAAAAGHASVVTAQTHYAKRRSGWTGLKLAGKPSEASIARVRGIERYFSPARNSAPAP